MSDVVPEGWVTCAPLQVADLVRGVSYEKGEATGVPSAGYLPLVRANNIAEGLVLEDLQYVPESRVSSQQRLQPGDVIVAMSSGSKSVVGKAASVRTPWHGTFGAFCGVLRPARAIDSAYFGLFFKTQYYRRLISGLSAGTNINNLKREYFDELSLPLAPVPEQRRIVAKAEALLEQVNRARDRLARMALLLKRFRQAVLAAACSGRLTEQWRQAPGANNDVDQLLRHLGQRGIEPAEPLAECPSTWRWIQLDDLRQPERPIIYGIIKPGPHVPEGVPYVRVLDMKNGTIDVAQLKRASPERAELFRRATLVRGDILISKDGTIGRVAVVPAALEGGNITQHLVRFSPHPLLNREYLVLALQSPFVQGWLTSEKKGVALQGVNVEDFRRLPIPIPSVGEQAEIVSRVTDLFAFANAIARRVGAAAVRIRNLPESILSKAFSGELVPTEAEIARAEGREYESALQLLARIAKSGISANATSSRRSRKRQSAEAKG